MINKIIQSQIFVLEKYFLFMFSSGQLLWPTVQAQQGSARQSKTPIQAYKGKTTWARLLQAAGVCLKNAPCFKIQNTAGQKCQEKLVKIKLQFKLGKSISRNFCPFLFLKKNVFRQNIIQFELLRNIKKRKFREIDSYYFTSF